jgi:hypothetical protein
MHSEQTRTLIAAYRTRTRAGDDHSAALDHALDAMLAEWRRIDPARFRRAYTRARYIPAGDPDVARLLRAFERALEVAPQ